MIQRTILVGGVLAAGTLLLFIRQLALAASPAEARTVAMTTMVLFQNLHIFSSRSFTRSVFELDPFSTPYLLASVVAALGLHVMAVYLPPFQFFLDTVPLSAGTWAVIAGVASSVLFVVEIDKAIRRALR
jgi:Ca2+-transporting ATPase